MFTLVSPTAHEVGSPHFQNLARTETYGGRSYPGLGDYRQIVGEFQGGGKDPLCYAAAQLNWHNRGQNGCLFAQMAAKKAHSVGWEYLVNDTVAHHLTQAQVVEIDDQVEQAIKRDGTQMLSLLFPEVTDPRSAVNVIRQMAQWGKFWLEHDVSVEVESGYAQVMHLRYPVQDSQSWAVAFGPFASANTRKAPFFEIAVRVKEKPQTLRPELNQVAGVAHLADVSLAMTDTHFAHRMKSTKEKTLRILGGAKDPAFNAAKVTLYVHLDSTEAGGLLHEG